MGWAFSDIKRIIVGIVLCDDDMVVVKKKSFIDAH